MRNTLCKIAIWTLGTAGVLLFWYISATRYYYAEVNHPAEIRQSLFYHQFLMEDAKLYLPVKRGTNLSPFLGICRQYFTLDEEKLFRLGQTHPECRKFISEGRAFFNMWGE